MRDLLRPAMWIPMCMALGALGITLGCDALSGAEAKKDSSSDEKSDDDKSDDDDDDQESKKKSKEKKKSKKSKDPSSDDDDDDDDDDKAEKDDDDKAEKDDEPPVADGPVELAADGLPAVIPAKGSAAPTTDEWDAVTQEVTVKGSSALNCETKMVREWLRVSCRKSPAMNPQGLTRKGDGRQQSFEFINKGDRTSLVVQVVKNAKFTADFFWTNRRATLHVDWPQGAPRPILAFK